MKVLTIHDDGSVEEFEIADELFTPYAPRSVVPREEPESFGHVAALMAVLSASP